MRQRASLLFLRGDEILLIYRYREGRTYYITPGGGVEPGETVIEAAYREAWEETGLEIKLGPLLWERPLYGGAEHAFRVASFQGELRLGGPELEKQSAENLYRFEWVPLMHLPQLDLYPPMDEAALTILAQHAGL